MKEIKFRAWVPVEKTICEVLIIDYKARTVQLPIQTAVTDTYWWDETVWNFEEVVLMQYTGLKDKNGVEIYEGDVVEYAGKRYLVEWEDYMFNLKGFYEPYLDIPYSAFSEELEFEVFGNAYEHPHLLEANE